MSAPVTAPGACPKCTAHGFANPGALAAHLIDAHDMTGLAALAMARQTAGGVRAGIPANPIPAKETPMKACKNCGGDHRSDNKLCPKHGGTNDGGGGRVASKPRAAAKRKPITRKHPMPPKKAAGATSNGLVSELEALTTVVEALTGVDSFESKLNVLLCACRLLQIDPTKLAA